MKIALVSDWYLPRLGGIERHLADLAAHLAAAGNEVTVITPMDGACAESPVRLQQVPAQMLPGVRVCWAPSAFRRLGRTLREGDFDVVHVHTSIVSPAAFAALYHAQRAGLPALATNHSILGRSAPIFRQLDRWFHWRDWPITFSGVSERVADELRALVAPRPVYVLPNAIDLAAWCLPARAPADVVNFACVMRLVPRKRGTALLRAFRNALSALPRGCRARLRIAGDGPERAKLERLARSLGLQNAVEFLGALTPSAVKYLLSTSHAFVLPSRLEAFGIAALEARAAGLPVIAMSDSGVREFVVDGVDGLLASDDHALAQHMMRLCVDPALRKRIAEHNRVTPVAFTWDRAIAAHLELYERARELCAPHSVAAEGAFTSEGRSTRTTGLARHASLR